MYLKDHYKILELELSATLPEIKKAYRRLALQYHPDKTQDDPYAAAQFNDIKEAYETLSNPSKKNAYLEERWYNRAMGNNKTADVITPVSILKQSLQFERYTADLDQFRLDKNSLFEFMDKLLIDDTIGKLATFQEPEINEQIALTLIKPFSLLEPEQAELISKRLMLVADKNEKVLSIIESTLKNIQRKTYWQSRQWIFILLLTAAILFLIWYSGN